MCIKRYLAWIEQKADSLGFDARHKQLLVRDAEHHYLVTTAKQAEAAQRRHQQAMDCAAMTRRKVAPYRQLMLEGLLK
jgi:hypothetical protein